MLLLKHFLVGGDVCNIVLSRLPASYQGLGLLLKKLQTKPQNIPGSYTRPVATGNANPQHRIAKPVKTCWLFLQMHLFKHFLVVGGGCNIGLCRLLTSYQGLVHLVKRLQMKPQNIPESYRRPVALENANLQHRNAKSVKIWRLFLQMLLFKDFLVGGVNVTWAFRGYWLATKG